MTIMISATLSGLTMRRRNTDNVTKLENNPIDRRPFGGRLEKYGVREKMIKPFHLWESIEGQEPIMDKPLNGDALPNIPGTTERNRFLTDGRNVILVMISERSFLFEITRYGDNDPNEILWAIDREFEAGLIDEDHPDYWQGYEWREGRDNPDREPSDDNDEKS
jgi:hypothetical protein